MVWLGKYVVLIVPIEEYFGLMMCLAYDVLTKLKVAEPCP